MKNATSPVVKSPGPTREWEVQYEKDFTAQKNSGPIVFTEEQRRKNKEVVGLVSDLLPFQDAYKVNDCDLIYRFLIGKHWNVNHAEKGLREYIEVRTRDHLDGLIGEQLHPTIGAVLCPCYSNGTPCPIYGLDKDGLPILWLSPDASKVIAAMKEFTDKELLRGQMRAIELGRFVCRARGVDRCTYVIDLGGITMSSVNKATLGFLKGVTNMLQVAYPEIMRRLLVFNTGWAVSAAWKVLRPFVDVRVQDKIKFESGPPTLAALKPYMDADQVHPAFGGTGKENVLDPLIAAEIYRLRRLAEGGELSESVSPVQRPSTSWHDDGSLFDVNPQTLHSFYCSTLIDGQQNTSTDGVNPPLDRMVIGVPRAVSAWMANIGKEGEGKDVLDMALSVASSSSDYSTEKSAADETVSQALPLMAGDTALPTSSSPQSRRVSAVSPTSATAPPPPSTGVPLREKASTSLSGVRAEEELPIVALSLTYGADGSITGHCGQTCVGQFRNGRFYALPRELDGDQASSPESSPLVPSPGALPGNDHHNRRGCVTNSSDSQQKQPSSASRGTSPMGEVLYEAGHPIHNFYIVCDRQRCARYLLRRSRLRTRLTVYNVVGGAPVRTKNSRHYVEGERAKLGVTVPSTDPTSDSKGDWMLYGEDLTQRSRRQQIKNFFSKAKQSSVTVADGSESSGAEKEKATGWPTSMFAAIRTSAANAITSPSKRKVKSKAARGSDDASSGAVAAGPSEATAKPTRGKAGNGGAQLLAENKGQTVHFYHLLTKNPLPDLFALAVTITLSWSGELEVLKDKPRSKATRYISEDEDFMA